MTTWLEKLLVPDLVEAYLDGGYALNFGYAVSADSISADDSARELVAALDLDGPDGPLAGADTVHTLRFPLLPTDTVYPAMGGVTEEERAVARGDFLELPPLRRQGHRGPAWRPRGSAALRRPDDPARRSPDPPADLQRRGRGRRGHLPGPVPGLEEADGTKTSPGRPDPLSMQAFRVREADSLSPGQFNFSDDGSIRDVIGLRRADNGSQRRTIIELDQIAQAGIVKVHGTWKGIPVRAMGIADDGERWEIMSLAHDALAAQERGMRRVEAGVYSAIIDPQEAQTTFTLLSMPSWPQG